ncbi:FAD-dependent monooxygenase [uncultured Friedmanniella sp.]|uniref:FAD-dependent monooxygenase n=1 Tax=uncultured Friedmanniella sp. TaxID=335381 RepID=UPI0035CA4470
MTELPAQPTARENGSEPRPEAVEIAVIGGGIGGAAAAVALRGAGFDVHVFERAGVLREIGGAVVIRQPSIDLFDRWGVGEAFRQDAVEIPGVEVRDATSGAVLGQHRLDVDGTGAAWSAHRADVHSALLAALPPETIHLGVTTEAVRTDDDGAVAAFADGQSVRARLIVGADGIRSVTRKLISDDETVFAHLVVIRSMVSAESLPAELSNDTVRMWGNQPLALVTLPLRGGRTVAIDTIVHADVPPEHLWTSEVPLAELAERFADFDPVVPRLIAGSSEMVKANPVFDREPLTTWSTGAVTLLGDAAHPMAPRMGQGANSAIQDAGALAAALTEHGLDDLASALAAYEQERIPTATAMQLGSRQAPSFSPAR